MASQPLAGSERPTMVRYGVLAFACSLSMITYLDRVCFGTAATNIIADLNLNSIADLKWAITAFVFAYAAFEVPTGFLGDVFGPKKTLIRIVIWWSAFTALTAFVGMPVGSWIPGVWTLVVIRFLFGIGEAGAYPNITRALHNWLPATERGFAQGMVWMSGRLMGGLTPLVWAVLVTGIGNNSGLVPSWRWAFWLFGVLGVLWCVVFAFWFKNRPEEKPGVNAAELALINQGHEGHASHSDIPWLSIFTSRNLWALCMMYFCAAFAWYFNITYLHTFMEEQYGVDPKSFIGAVYKGGPLWLGAIGCLLGGVVTDALVRRTKNLRRSRQIMGVVGHAACSLCFFGAIAAPTAFTFFVAISSAAFFNDLTMGAAWATCQDIGRKYSAIVAGCMNTIGNMGGAVAGALTGYILDAYLAGHAETLRKTVETLSKAEKATASLPAYHVCFLLFGAFCGFAVVCWLLVDASKPIAPDEPPTHA